MNPMPALKAEFDELSELYRVAPGEQVKANALRRIDGILDSYNALIAQTFVQLVETEMVEYNDAR